MSNPTPSHLSVTVEPTFLEVFSASLVMIKYRWQLIMLNAVFPLAGIFILVATTLSKGRPDAGDCFVALLALGFTPLVTAVVVWSSRRNRLARGSITYTFDAEGVHTSNEVFNQSIRWSAIPRVRRSKGFLFIFVAPNRAHCIPVRAIRDPGFYDDLRRIAEGLTDFGF